MDQGMSLVGRHTQHHIMKSMPLPLPSLLDILLLIFCSLDCTVSLSLFADPERILRRFYVFAEEPCKSTITTSEPCSPVFKEAQPRPSNNQNKEGEPFIQSNLILVHNVFLLLVIYCCNKASIRIVPKQKELVSSGYPSHQK